MARMKPYTTWEGPRRRTMRSIAMAKIPPPSLVANPEDFVVERNRGDETETDEEMISRPKLPRKRVKRVARPIPSKEEYIKKKITQNMKATKSGGKCGKDKMSVQDLGKALNMCRSVGWDYFEKPKCKKSQHLSGACYSVYLTKTGRPRSKQEWGSNR